jgi:putative endonuclease
VSRRSVDRGRESERAAVRFLRRSGFRILATNYRSPYGELDIVARDGNTIAFIEVKSRADLRHGGPAEAIDRTKRKRIARAASHYISRFGLGDRECRFDAIAIVDGKAAEHVKGAFEHNG